MMRRWSLLTIPVVVALATTPVSAGASTDDLRWQIDNAYGETGRAHLDGVYDAGLVVLPSGRAYLLTEPVRGSDQVSLVRFTPTGELDRTFGDDGFVTLPAGPLEHLAIEAQMTPSGRRLVISEWTSSRVTPFYRFRMDGRLDRSFGNGGVAGIFLDPFMEMTVRDLAIGKGQSVVAGGECSKNDITFRPCLLSLTADGEPNDRFGGDGFKLWTGNGTLDSYTPAVAVSADGSRIYLGGRNRPSSRWLIGAFDPKGRLDKTFAEDGRAELRPPCQGSGTIATLHPEATGELIASGGQCEHSGLARLTHDGTLDPTYGDGGWVRLRDGDTHITSTYDPTTRSVYWLHDDTSDLHVGSVQSDGSPDPAFGPEGELVLEVGAENFWNRAIATDNEGRIYGKAWYAPDDIERVVLFRAVKVEGVGPG